MHKRVQALGKRLQGVALEAVVIGGVAVGAVSVAAAARPTHLTVHAASAFGVHLYDRPRAAMLGFGALAVAHGLARHRYLAWWGAALTVAAWGLVSVHGHPVRVVLLGAALAVLTVSRDNFYSGPDRDRLRQLGWVTLSVLGLVLVVRLVAIVPRGHTLTHHVFTLAVAGGLAILIVALAPAPAPEPGSPAERSAVRRLIHDGPPDSLAPFALRQDRSYVFSPDGGAAVGYRVVLSTALAAGDPVGDPARAPAAMAAFLDLCARQGWRPGVLGASETTVGAWRALGLRGLEIGDEAVLDPADFTLSSRRMRNVRQAVSRSANAGIDIHIGAFDAATADELGLVLQDWLGGRKLRGFSMNLDQVLSPHPDVVIATARSADGELVAFARFLRGADGQVLTLDVAPRRGDAPNGTVERLVVAVVEHARALGVREVSLNFAGLRRVLESDAASARVAMALARGLDRWIDVRRLYQFSAKFQPAWRTRSLLMGSWLSLFAVGTAAFLAELRPTTPPGSENGPTDAPAADAAPAPVPPL